VSLPSGKTVAVGLGLVLVLGFTWSQLPSPRGEAAAAGAEPRRVRVAEVRGETLPLISEAVGTVRSADAVVISSQLMAEVLAVSVDAGDKVLAGESLVELDSASLQAREAAAAASLAVVDENLKDAEREWQRTRQLFEREARTQREADQATTRRAEALSRRDAARSAVTEAQVSLRFARVLAPFDGVVLERRVDPGDLALPGQPLIELYDPGSLRLEVSLSAGLLGHVAVGDELPVTLDALGTSGGEPLGVTGLVDELVPAVDPATRTALAKISLPGPANEPELRGLLPGMFGRARLVVGERPGVVIPTEALVLRGQLETVFVASPDGTQARMQIVRSGRRLDDGRVEILSGLGAGQRVVVGGAGELRDGTPIVIAEATPRRGG